MDRNELIDKFLTHSLNAEEKLFFDELMVNDPSFKEKVKFFEDLQKVTEFEDDTFHKAMIADFEAEHQSKKSLFFNSKVWLVAASIAVLIAVFYVFNLPQTYNTQELFAENFKPYRNVVQPIVRSADQQDLSTKAFSYYEKREYEMALTLFEELYKETKTPHYLFYKANTLLQLNRPKDAINDLEAHLKTSDKLVQKTNWYLAMAYLKLDDVANAKKSLKKVIAENAYNAKKAKTLLAKLE